MRGACTYNAQCLNVQGTVLEVTKQSNSSLAVWILSVLFAQALGNLWSNGQSQWDGSEGYPEFYDQVVKG